MLMTINDGVGVMVLQDLHLCLQMDPALRSNIEESANAMFGTLDMPRGSRVCAG
jgi:hypothetical protein